MDTTTVLEIIKMIDNKLAHYIRVTGEDLSYVESKETGLVDLRDQLQLAIEDQLNAEENKTEQ